MGGHIYGTHFYRKYAPPQKFSPKNWQIYVIFLHLKCQFFCDVNKLPNLHDYVKTSPKNSLRKHRENFFRKYAPLFIEGGGHNYGNYCTGRITTTSASLLASSLLASNRGEAGRLTVPSCCLSRSGVAR